MHAHVPKTGIASSNGMLIKHITCSKYVSICIICLSKMIVHNCCEPAST